MGRNIAGTGRVSVWVRRCRSPWSVARWFRATDVSVARDTPVRFGRPGFEATRRACRLESHHEPVRRVPRALARARRSVDVPVLRDLGSTAGGEERFASRAARVTRAVLARSARATRVLAAPRRELRARHGAPFGVGSGARTTACTRRSSDRVGMRSRRRTSPRAMRVARCGARSRRELTRTTRLARGACLTASAGDGQRYGDGHRHGELVEYGDTVQVFDSPRDERTADYVAGRFG